MKGGPEVLLVVVFHMKRIFWNRAVELIRYYAGLNVA